MSISDDEHSYALEPDPEPLNCQDQTTTHLPIESVSCKQCGYDLSGLFEYGVCPECNYSIALSLEEDLLEFSSPKYLSSLHLGVRLILISLVIKFLSILGSFVFSFVLAMYSMPTDLVELLSSLVDLVSVGFGVVGWWMFTTQDPTFSGNANGSVSRKIVRVTTVINLITALALVPLSFLVMSSTNNSILGAVILIGLFGFGAWIVGYFAAMQYLCWMAPRIPDMRVYDRARMFMWLGPLLFTVGWLCIGLGPLIGFVLYYFMFNWVRTDIAEIRIEQRFANRVSDNPSD
jgi:hypothetical protein